MNDSALAQQLPLDAVLGAMPNGVVMLDSRGMVSHANPAAQTLLAHTLVNHLWRDIIACVFAPREDDGHEVSLASGARVRLDISALSPHPGQLIVITDMSETRALQERVSHMQRLSAMGRMVASLAHQIRTPLSAAMLYAQNLCRETLPVPQRQKFSQKLSDRLRELEQQVNDMLLFAKSGEQLPVAHIQLSELVQTVCDQVEPIRANSQIQFDVIAAPQDATLLGNMSALTSALQNLIMNALEACQPGHRVVLHTHIDAANIQVAVSDNGPGIAEADLQQIFTPFFTRKSQGTGLGLAVVKTVAKAHQGDVRVHSELGRGTTFSMIFPIAERPE